MKKSVQLLSTRFKNKVLDYFKEGKTAVEISLELNEEYRKETGKDMTRNACLGIKFRAGQCQAVSRLDRSKYVQPPKGFKKRICLRCHHEKWIEEQNRICMACKKTEDWQHSTSLSHNEIYI